MIQQASIDYLDDPTRTNALILDAVETFDNGWVYSQGVADFARRDDQGGRARRQRAGRHGRQLRPRPGRSLIELAIPVYEALGQSPKEGLTAEDIVTNEFIDPSIGF